MHVFKWRASLVIVGRACFLPAGGFIDPGQKLLGAFVHKAVENMTI